MGSRFGPGTLRLTLAVLVFISHVSRFNIGRAAVVLFFMLSGFWVTRLFDQRRDASVIPYLRDRFLRVWPLLAVTALTIAAAFALAGREPHGSLASTLGLFGLATRGHDIIGVAWSLDIEMQFYLALPFVVIALARCDPAIRPAVTIAVLAVASVIGAVLIAHGFRTLLAYVPAFAAGAVIWRSKWVPAGSTVVTSFALYCVLLALLVALPVSRWMVLNNAALPWWFDLSQTALCAALVPLIAWNVNQPSPPLDRHLGNLSYPFYLVHYPIVTATAGLVASTVLTKGLAFGLSIAAALALYIAVDRPLERLRHATMQPRPLPSISPRAF